MRQTRKSGRRSVPGEMAMYHYGLLYASYGMGKKTARWMPSVAYSIEKHEETA